MPFYVVTQPESIQGVFETWDACRAAVAGYPGARYQKVASREEAEAMLSGAGVVLAPGLYAFTDGNHLGGVGVVVVRVPEDVASDPDVQGERATSVAEVFSGAGIPGLVSDVAVGEELARLRNILAELAGLYAAITFLPEGSEATVVHDYKGVGAWMEGRWKMKDPVVAAVISASRALASSKRLQLRFLHQRGHMSTWAGRHDLARFNGHADKLATQGATSK